MVNAAANTPRPDAADVWRWLQAVPDPEVPVVSVVDLGIVREVRWEGEELVVVMTPTYAGCPALTVIRDAIGDALAGAGVAHYRVDTRLSPAWTTDWLSARGREKLRGYGIAPPAGAAEQVIDISRIGRRGVDPDPACPHCGAAHSSQISRFGSTPCKALYRCLACREPFDYFKPI